MKETKTMNARPLSVVGVDIAQDDHGRYSLNDLHRAAMAAGSATESHKPGNFMQSAGVQAFLDALEASDLTAGIPAIKTEPGRYGGTYGARLVVLRYAAWIAPAFEVQVYRCFDEVTQDRADAYRVSDDARRVREVFAAAAMPSRAMGLKGAARVESVRAVVADIAPELLHLVPERPGLKGKPDEPSPADLVAVVRDWLIQHGPALPDLLALRAAAAATPGQRMAAADFMDEARGEYVISPHTFASVICKGWNAVAVAAALRDAGHLVHEAGRLTRSRRFPGGSLAKCYTVRAALLS